jgi:hypothetical protein
VFRRIVRANSLNIAVLSPRLHPLGAWAAGEGEPVAPAWGMGSGDGRWHPPGVGVAGDGRWHPPGAVGNGFGETRLGALGCGYSGRCRRGSAPKTRNAAGSNPAAFLSFRNPTRCLRSAPVSSGGLSSAVRLGADQAIACPCRVTVGTRTGQGITSFVESNIRRGHQRARSPAVRPPFSLASRRRPRPAEAGTKTRVTRTVSGFNPSDMNNSRESSCWGIGHGNIAT